MHTSLVIGFDSAWSMKNSGAMVGALKTGNHWRSLGIPLVVNLEEAANLIKGWQEKHQPITTLILIDQPTVVPNMRGQRPVENIVGSSVSRRYGGVQPSSRSKQELFGDDAPIWAFINSFDGACNPTNLSCLHQKRQNCVIETYPALAMLAMGWVLVDNHQRPRATGRLPKYNPANRKQFSITDWEFVCRQTASGMQKFALKDLSNWLRYAEKNTSPRKEDQDCLDACICLLVGMLMAANEQCLFVGNEGTGYMVVPHGETLHQELTSRCENSIPARFPNDWLVQFRMELKEAPLSPINA